LGIKFSSDMPPKKKSNEIEIREPKIDKDPFKLAANDFKSEFDALLAADDTLDINAKDEFGFTPLLWSVKNGHVDMATYLLSKGAAIEAVGVGGMRGLHLASANVRENLVAVLLEHGADPNGLDDAGNTAMHWAAVRGILNIVIRLLAKGGDPNVKNKQGITVKMPTPAANCFC
jgi:ankyrin repeat protein